MRLAFAASLLSLTMQLSMCLAQAHSRDFSHDAPNDTAEQEPRALQRRFKIAHLDPVGDDPTPEDMVEPLFEVFHEPLPVSKITCFEDAKPFNQDNYSWAKRALFHWCRSETARGLHMELKGDVIVYICGWGVGNHGHTSRCEDFEFIQAEKWFDVVCGPNKSAVVELKKFGKSYGRSHLTSELACS